MDITITEKKENNILVRDGLILLVVTFAFLSALDYTDVNIFSVITFLLNGSSILIFMMLARKKAGYSIELVYWMFMYFFMFFAPLIQYTRSDFPWIHVRHPEDIIIAANLSILFWNIIIAAIFNISWSKKTITVISKNHSDYEISESLCMGVTLVAILIAGAYFAANGLSIFSASRNSGVAFFSSEDSALSLLANKVIAAVLNFAAIFSLQFGKKTGRYTYFILCLIAVVIGLFPTRLARYLVGVVYGSLIISGFKFVRQRSVFFWGLTFAFLLVFPFMEVYRTVSPTEVNLLSTLSSVITNFWNGYLEAHYDAYSMLCSVITYVKGYGTTKGMQLLGSVLFFVPRAIWNSKPVGSGYMVSVYLDFSFHNVSCPFIGEAIVNFGYIGVLIGSCFLGNLIKWCDNSYRKGEYTLFWDCFYPIAVMFVFFIMRGDLMSSFAYFSAYLSVFIVLIWLNKRLVLSKKVREEEWNH